MSESGLLIYLIRHAESEINLTPDLVGGSSNWADLTHEGIAQAKLLGSRFKNNDIKLEAVYCSPAIRTQQTARHFCERIEFPLYEIKLEMSLTELSQGDWEQKRVHEVYDRPEVIRNFNTDAWNSPSGDEKKGESQALVANRMKEGLDKIISDHEAGNIAVITHGMSIRCVLAEVMDIDRQTAHLMDVPYTSVAVIEVHDGRMLCLNYPSLLPSN
jgi:broad specificity phosphatase PhoE